MAELTRYTLDSKNILNYIQLNLENGNTLCKAVLKHIDFSKGEFFTFLKKNLSKETVNEPRNIHVGSGVKEKIKNFLFNKLNSEYYTCIFDDDEEDYKEGGNWDLYNQVGIHLDKEMYYLLHGNSPTKDLILKCLNASDIIWHALCVVSKHPYKQSKDKSISKEELEQIVINAKLILVLAYDAESYIIWEKFPE